MSATIIGIEHVQRGNATPFDVERIRAEFPILQTQVHGKPLVYLDNAATSQKPLIVLDALVGYYSTANANIHRAVHHLSEVATRGYEAARVKIQQFLNAKHPEEIIFVRGTTEGINLVASSYGRRLKTGDEIVLSALEHHSNIVPWQLLCETTGAVLKIAPINDDGEVILDEYEKLLGPRTKIVALVHVSNALGTINPVGQMIRMAHDAGAITVIDGAQSAPHLALDVQALDADFYTFSSHKIYGPTGFGALYGKKELLASMPPYQGGGDMIKSVTFEKSTYNDLPYRFEAGTPDVSGAIATAAAISFMQSVGFDALAAHENALLTYATQQISELPQVRIIGTAREKAGVLSFVVQGVHPHDLGTFMDRDGVAIRTGHHCAQPVMDRFGVPATARASFAVYNTAAEVDVFIASLRKTIEVFT